MITLQSVNNSIFLHHILGDSSLALAVTEIVNLRAFEDNIAITVFHGPFDIMGSSLRDDSISTIE